MVFRDKMEKVEKVKIKLQNAWEFIPKNKVPMYYSIASKIICCLVSAYSKFWFEWLNKPMIYNRNQFVSLVNERSKTNRGLLTVSNHYSCMDDPLLWGIRSWSQVLSISRWIPTAEEICFSSKVNRFFFSLGRCVPVVRGDGVYQRGMDFCLNKLNQGEWVHIFPEGGINMEQDNRRLKWGVGRLIADSSIAPIVLPMFHVGMDGILPNKKPYIPQIGKTVTVLVGKPVDYTEELIMLREQNKSDLEIRKYITDQIQVAVWKLKEEAELLHSGDGDGVIRK